MQTGILWWNGVAVFTSTKKMASPKRSLLTQIRVDICRTLYPLLDNPWAYLPWIRSNMYIPCRQALKYIKGCVSTSWKNLTGKWEIVREDYREIMLLSIYSSDIVERVWMTSSRFLKSNFCMFSRGAWWVYCIRYVTSSYVNSNKFSIFIRNKLGQMWGSMIFFPEKQCVRSFKLFSVAFDWPAFQCARFFTWPLLVLKLK